MRTKPPVFLAAVTSCTVIAALWMLLAGPANAQTNYVYYANGNRSGQAANSGTLLLPPFLPSRPKDQVAMLGGTARFSVLTFGFGPFSYQWFKGAAPISGATSDTLVIENLVAGDFTPSSTGSPKYSVQVTNAHSTVTSAAVGLYEDSLSTTASR